MEKKTITELFLELINISNEINRATKGEFFGNNDNKHHLIQVLNSRVKKAYLGTDMKTGQEIIVPNSEYVMANIKRYDNVSH